MTKENLMMEIEFTKFGLVPDLGDCCNKKNLTSITTTIPLFSLFAKLLVIRLATLINGTTTHLQAYSCQRWKKQITLHLSSQLACSRERTENGSHLGPFRQQWAFLGPASMAADRNTIASWPAGSPLNLFGCIYRDVSFSAWSPPWNCFICCLDAFKRLFNDALFF